MAYVSNGGWIDGNTADGMRLSMAHDFSHIWIFNLRGNARTSGELRRKEAGNVFESGSRNTVVVTLAVKDPAHTGPATIHYRDIGDYLTREDKLHVLTTAGLDDPVWETITPNTAGDWLNQRNDTFATYLSISEVFASSSAGVQTNRDAWCYNFGSAAVEQNMQRMISTYNLEASRGVKLDSDLDSDPTKISWSSSLRPKAVRGETHEYSIDSVRTALYRPFARQALYFDPIFNHRTGKNTSYFPTDAAANAGFYCLSPGSPKPFSTIATDQLPDLAMYGSNSGQFYPRWTYVPGPKRADSDALFDEMGKLVDGFRRVDNITDHGQGVFCAAFGSRVSKDDIFHYVYGVLHSSQYRTRFEADLRKSPPRIPFAGSAEDFGRFVDAGRRLLELHVDYETVVPYPLEEHVNGVVGEVDEYQLYRVEKLKFRSKTDRSALIFNKHITLTGIPDEAHDYMLGSRSALEWIIDRYRVKTDKVSGIVNDPNDWSREHNQPRYIIDLIKRVVTVSVETMKIVRGLPLLPLDG